MAKLWNKFNIDLADRIGIDAVIADDRNRRYDRHKADEPAGGKRVQKSKHQIHPRQKTVNFEIHSDYDALHEYFEQLIEAREDWSRFASHSVKFKDLSIFEDEAYGAVEVTAHDRFGQEWTYEEYEFINEIDLIDLGFVW